MAKPEPKIDPDAESGITVYPRLTCGAAKNTIFNRKPDSKGTLVMEITLRPAGPDDEEFLYKLYSTTRSGEVEAMGLDAAQREMFLRVQYVAQKLSYQAEFPRAIHDIILYEGRPAGRVMTMKMEKIHRYIDLAILPEYRNLGIGARIIEDLIKDSAEAGLTARLHVLKTNRARLLYERLGFVVTGEDDFNYIMEIAPAC